VPPLGGSEKHYLLEGYQRGTASRLTQ
jgi:hypothetical protein